MTKLVVFNLELLHLGLQLGLPRFAVFELLFHLAGVAINRFAVLFGLLGLLADQPLLHKNDRCIHPTLGE